MKRLVLLGLVSFALWAQLVPIGFNLFPQESVISALATDFTGSQVYLATKLRPVGTNFSGNPKMLRFVRGFHGQQWSMLVDGEVQSSKFNLFPFSQPMLSSDGAVVAVNQSSPCSIGLGPDLPGPFLGTTLLAQGKRTQLPHLGSVSPNGNHIVLFGEASNASCSPLPGQDAPGVFRFDPGTGVKTRLGNAPSSLGQLVANDGTALIRAENALRLVGPNGQTTLKLLRALSWAHLSADAKRLVHMGYPSLGFVFGNGDLNQEIRVYDIGTGVDRLLAFGNDPRVSVDGRTVAYLAGTLGIMQVWTADSVTGLSRPLTDIQEGVIAHAISGNGETVIVGTSSGRLLSVGVSNGVVSEILGAMPIQVSTMEGSALPGSLFRLQRVESSIDDLIGAPLPGGAPRELPQVTVAGVPATWVTKEWPNYALQTPWETKITPDSTVVVREGNLPWERVFQIGRPTIFPVKITGSFVFIREGEQSFAYHDNWKDTVFSQNPARRGGVVHMYGSGFGPVDGSVATGQPTPSNRLFRLIADCQWQASAQIYPDLFDARTFSYTPEFAGLAPGLVGVHQFDLKIPDNWSAPNFVAYCAKPGAAEPAFLLPSLPVGAPMP